MPTAPPWPEGFDPVANITDLERRIEEARFDLITAGRHVLLEDEFAMVITVETMDDRPEAWPLKLNTEIVTDPDRLAELRAEAGQ